MLKWHFFFFFDTVENIVGKGENGGNQHFLLFPVCFLKTSFSRVLKLRFVWCMVKTFLERKTKNK